MLSSSNYYNQMTRHNNTKSSLVNKKSSYETYLQKLKDLKAKLNPIKEDVGNTYSSFASGGYVSDGETLDQGQLQNKSSILESDIEVLENIIEKTDMLIEDIQDEINYYEGLYQTAKTNYYKALEEEKSE